MYEILRRTHEPHRYLIRPSLHLRTETAWTRLWETGSIQRAYAAIEANAATERMSHYRIEVQR